ncbi:TPA: hypothetical protein MYQ78_001394 [Klebsiella pneumoniae]|nr:hypothetical protein [Klebsiella pneumoniae]
MNASKSTNRVKDSTLAELIAAISLNEKSLPLALTRVALCELQERRKTEANNKPVAWTGAEQLRDANTQGCGYIFGLGIPAKADHQIMLYTNPSQVASDLFISGVRDEDGECSAVDDAAAQFWTVYRRNEDGTCDALMDFMSRESAEKAIQMIASPVEPQTESLPILNNHHVAHWSELRTDNFPEHTASTRQQIGGCAWLDWNQLSALGLIVRINKEILHPMGLALFRDPKTGTSEGALIAPDGHWSYSVDIEKGGVA